MFNVFFTPKRRRVFYAFLASFKRLEFKFALDIGDRLVDGNADLLHRVAIAYGDGIVLCRLEIDGYAERRADLVLAAVSLADRPREVVRCGEVLSDLRVNLVCFFGKTFLQGQYGAFVRRECGVKV